MPLRTERSTESLRAEHGDLLTVARAVRRSAVGDDTVRLHSELSQLRAELVHHLHAEREHLDALPGMAAAVIRDGQERLLRLLTDVLFSAGNRPDECNCIVRAAEVELALRRQATLETNLLHRHRLTAPRGSWDRAGR